MISGWTKRAYRAGPRWFSYCALIAGCSDGDGAPAKEPAADAGVHNPVSVGAGESDGAAALTPSTWHEHIAPLVSQKCGACHKENGIAPFSLMSYAAARPFARAMATAVESGTMPPFLASETDACTPRNPWFNDTRLNAEQKALLRAWADQGAPEGDLAKAAPIPAPPSTSLTREDSVMVLPEPIVVEKSAQGDIHTCIVVDPKFTQDVYVVGRQITSGNDKVLHHVVTYALLPETSEGTVVTRAQMEQALITTKGVGIGGRYPCFGGPELDKTGLASELLGGWAPGATPTTSPPNSGQPLKKDTLVIMDVHYHPIAQREEDRTTKLSLMFADQKPLYVARPLLLGNFVQRSEYAAGVGELVKQPEEAAAEFKIPAGAQNHVEEMTWTWTLPAAPLGIRAYFAGTHMHYVGRDMMVQLENTTPQPGEPARECLVQTPRWDFNWQGGYGYLAPYDQLPLMNPGDVLRMRCVYDNTMQNKFLARALDEQGLTAPVDVTLGEDTLDEMCLAAIGIMYPNPL